MNRIIVSLLIFLLSCWGLFCSLEKPTAPDGTMCLKILVVDTTGTLPCNPNCDFARVEQARVRIKSTDYDDYFEFYTDENGELLVENLLASHYLVSVDKQVGTGISDLFDHLILAGSMEYNACPQNTGKINTIPLDVAIFSNLVINEIYYSGITANGYPYTSDQYIEICNNSTKTLFLDGLILARLSSNLDYIGTGFVEIVYGYQFPGNGQQCPIHPGELIVVAQDAINHCRFALESIDLSNADYECFLENVGDIDNPTVPNLFPINPNFKNDMMINTLWDAIILIKSINSANFKFNSKGYMLFNTFDVLDGIKYTNSHDVCKYLETKVDAGFAGYNILRFCGKSIERHHPYTGGPGYDTNNSTFDFVTLSHPTPGWQHSPEDIIPPNP